MHEPSLSFCTLLSTAGFCFNVEWVSSTAGSPYQMSSRRECAPCFFYSVLLAVVLGRPQLKAWFPSAGDRPFCTEVQLQRFTWPQTRHTRHITSGVTGDKEKALSVLRGYSPELEQIQSFKFIPHCTVTNSTIPQSAGEALGV